MIHPHEHRTVREAKSRRRALQEDDRELLVQIERRRSLQERQRALFAAGLKAR